MLLEAEPKAPSKFASYTNYELFCRVIELARQFGSAGVRAKSKRSQDMAAMIGIRKEKEAAVKEFLARMGDACARPAGRADLRSVMHIFNAKRGRGSRCDRCRKKGCPKGKGLFFILEGQHEAWGAAQRGAPLERVQTLESMSEMLCRSCSKDLGARFHPDGSAAIGDLL